MSQFKKLNRVKIVRNAKTGEFVEIFKYSKTGTKQVYFVPEVTGKRITSTMWARLYDAESVAKIYLKRVQ